MTYRDDLEAAGERARALERDLARAEEENERLRRELDSAKGDGLADMAAEGRAIADAADEAAHSRAVAAKRAQLEEAQEAFPRALTPWGFFATGKFVGGFTGIAWLFMGYIFLQTGTRFPPLAAFAVPPIAALLLFVFARGGVQSALARERAWLAALPFKVLGYEHCFTGAARELQTLVNFKGTPPKLELVRDALRVLGPDSGVRDGGGGALRLHVPLDVYRGNEHTINRRIRARFHEVVGLLGKVHAEYPIDRVHPESR